MYTLHFIFTHAGLVVINTGYQITNNLSTLTINKINIIDSTLDIQFLTRIPNFEQNPKRPYRTMTSTSEGQEPLQERLKDQVSVSIKEALDRANTVLTNLHRVQSYLDVIRILSTHRSSDVIKNALEQIHAARNDTATLLQHIYLTEIGLQSLQVM